MTEDRLLAGLRGTAAALDAAAPPIGATDVPAGVPGPDRRPLLALVACFVLLVGGLAVLLVDRDGDDGSVVTPGPGPTSTTSTTTLAFDELPGVGVAIQRGEGPMTLYGLDGLEVATMPVAERDDPNLPPALVLTPMNELEASPALAEVPEGCTGAAGGGEVRVALCGLDNGDSSRRVDVVGSDGIATPLVGTPLDPGAPTVLGHWQWVLVSPDGAWALLQWSGECESQSAFVVATDGSGELRSVDGGDWLADPETRGLGWAPDGRAIVEIQNSGCSSPTDAPGTYLLDPATGDRELLRAAVEDGEIAYSWTKQSGFFNLPELILDRALDGLGYEPFGGEPSHGGALVTSGVVYEGYDLTITGGPVGDPTLVPAGAGQRMPLLSGEALLVSGAVYFTCGPHTWVIGWFGDGTPELDSMLLFAEELVPRLACTLRTPPG